MALPLASCGPSLVSPPDAQLTLHPVCLELRGGGLMLARPVMGAALQFGVGVAVREFEASRHVAGTRRDLKAFADITAVFKEVDYYGFNPSATFTASSNSSNVDLFDVNRVGLSLGLRSYF